MYRKPMRISGSNVNLDNYINGADVYNSLAVKRLTDPTLDKIAYVITRFDFRPDLIAEDIYGSPGYMGVLMIQCGSFLENYQTGNVLSILPKSTVDRVLNSL